MMENAIGKFLEITYFNCGQFMYNPMNCFTFADAKHFIYAELNRRLKKNKKWNFLKQH